MLLIDVVVVVVVFAVAIVLIHSNATKKIMNKNTHHFPFLFNASQQHAVGMRDAIS
jgi:hypothetical protein